jgi:hypothetical protein
MKKLAILLFSLFLIPAVYADVVKLKDTNCVREEGVNQIYRIPDVPSLEACIGLCLVTTKPLCEGGRYNANTDDCRLVRYNMSTFDLGACKSGRDAKKRTQFFLR